MDDVVVYRRAADDLLVCVNAGNRQKDFDWLAGHAGGADVRNESDEWAQLALQGPLAAQLLQRLTKVNLSQLRSYRFAPGRGRGRPLPRRAHRLHRRGRVRALLPGRRRARGSGTRSWRRASPRRSQPCGLGARDSLRLEMAYRLYGSDMDDATTPLEAGLGWVVKLDKGDFVGRDALLRQKEQGVARKLVGFVADRRRASRATATRCCRTAARSAR